MVTTTRNYSHITNPSLLIKSYKKLKSLSSDFVFASGVPHYLILLVFIFSFLELFDFLFQLFLFKLLLFYFVTTLSCFFSNSLKIKASKNLC